MSRSALLLLVAALALLLGGWSLGEYRERALAQRPLLPVAFEHSDHAGQPCADCHHNFVDGTGGGACYYCHKMDPEINQQIETMFHDFCRGCHVETRHTGEDAGPLRNCADCHSGPREPAS